MYQVIIVTSKEDANACIDSVREAQGLSQMVGADWFQAEATDGNNTYAANMYSILPSDLLPLQNSGLVHHDGYYDTLEDALSEAQLTQV